MHGAWRIGRVLGVTVLLLFAVTAGALAAGGRVYAHSSLSNLTYSYQLAGHTSAGGYAGTFHYHESEGPAYRCDSHVLHWSAHPRPGGFP